MHIDGVTAAGGTHIGSRHRRNDDCYLVDSPDAGHLLAAVSDGMGGHPMGDVAATDAIGSLSALSGRHDDWAAALIEAVARADAKISGRVARDDRLEGMGATLTAALISRSHVWWVHIGDSRLYLFRDGLLTQVTRDHTFLQDFIDTGELSREGAERHPMAHVLDQCVGCMDNGPDSGCFAIGRSDVLLLCTDGIYRAISEPHLAHLLSAVPDAGVSSVVENLLDAAASGGADDDCTAVVVARDDG